MQDQTQNNVASPQTTASASASAPTNVQNLAGQNDSKLAHFLGVFKWVTMFSVLLSFVAPIMWGRDWNWTWTTPIVSAIFLALSWLLLKRQKTVFSAVLMIIAFLDSFVFILSAIVFVFLFFSFATSVLWAIGGGGH